MDIFWNCTISGLISAIFACANKAIVRGWCSFMNNKETKGFGVLFDKPSFCIHYISKMKHKSAKTIMELTMFFLSNQVRLLKISLILKK